MFKKKNKKDKKKKSWLRRILKWTGLTFLFLILAAILIPILFKDQIIQVIKDEANKTLNAKLDFGEVGLSLLTTFPSFELSIDDLSLTGVDTFENVALAKIKQTNLKLDLWSVVSGDQYSISSVGLVEPQIYIKVLENGKANYDIVKPDTTAKKEEESAPFNLSLEEYYIQNGSFVYDDESLATFVEVKGLGHEGEATIDGDTYTLETTSDMGEFTLGYDNIYYISDAVSDIKCNLQLAMPETQMKITFMDNEAVLNELGVRFDGWLLMKDDLMDMDLSFATTKQSFKSLLSMVPGVYSPDFGDIQTDGSLELNGKVFGEYSERSMPGMDMTLRVKDAWLQYPDVPSKIEKIGLDVSVHREEGLDFNNMTVDVNEFHMEFVGNEIDASLKLSNMMEDPYMESGIKSYLDLSKLKNVLPTAEGEEYSGVISSDIELKGNASALMEERYNDFHAKGSLSVQEMMHKNPEMGYSTAIQSMLFEFSPTHLNLEKFNAKIGSSDLHANGKIDNYLKYLFNDEVLKGNFNFTSHYLNLDELMFSGEPTEPQEAETTNVPVEPYTEVMAIPENINFKLNSTIDRILFDSLEMRNMNGVVVLNKGKAELRNLRMGVFDGSIGVSGSYEAVRKDLAQVDLDLSMKNMDIPKSAMYFNTIERFTPMAKYCTGQFSTDFSMVSQLTPTMEPVYESLTGKGKMTTKRVQINNYPALNKLAEAIKIKELKSQTIENLLVFFSFKDGRIWFDPYQVKTDQFTAEVEGSTSFKQELDYDIKMNIPSNILGSEGQSFFQSALGQAGDAGIELDDEIPLKVKVGGTSTKPTITTDLKNQGQNLANDIIDQGKDKLRAEAQKIIDDAQKQADQLLAEAKAKADKIRSEGKTAADKIRSEGKKAANKIRRESKNAAEKVREEGYAEAQKLVDEAKNPIAKIAAEKAAEKLRKETDKKADDMIAAGEKKAKETEQTAENKAVATENEADGKAKAIEDEAQKKADAIMVKAQKEADRINE